MELLLETFDKIEFYYRPDTHDYSILREVWKGRCYAKYFPFNKKAVIVDIGAHNGYFALFAAKHTHQDSMIYAFEPVKANFDLLCQNIALNGIANIKAKNVAVRSEDGFLTLYINKAHSGGHSVYKERVEVYQPKTIESLNVPCVAFKHILPSNIPKIDFCKIDCEGGEFGILLSASEKQLRRVNVFAIEFHEFGGHTVKELKEIFESIGYIVEILYLPSKLGITYGSLCARCLTTIKKG